MQESSQLKNYYDNYWSAGHDWFSGSRQGYAANFRRWMASELAGLRGNPAILEVGCGDATFTSELAKVSRDVTAIDLSSAQIEDNARRHPGILFRQHDVADRLPFEDGSFSVVWCSEVLEHLFDPAFALREMHRVLKPDGRLLVTVPYHGLFKNLLIVLFKWDEHFTPSNPHIRFFSRSTLSRIVAAAGFESIRTRTCGMGVPGRDLIVPTNLLLNARKGTSAQ